MTSGWLANTVERAMLAAPFTRAEIVQFTRHAIDGSWADDELRSALGAAVDSFVAPDPSGRGSAEPERR